MHDTLDITDLKKDIELMNNVERVYADWLCGRWAPQTGRFFIAGASAMFCSWVMALAHHLVNESFSWSLTFSISILFAIFNGLLAIELNSGPVTHLDKIEYLLRNYQPATKKQRSAHWRSGENGRFDIHILGAWIIAEKRRMNEMLALRLAENVPTRSGRF
ncbi:hypothetical protein [Ideonella margarita]|uniref:DUF4231 domain-containing protein n=1 Tax=Ideonella margarita TaxID=2984191 RepID=A0ABU9C7M1_9BURK